MKIKPLSDKVVIKPLEAEQKTASGIVIPDTAKEKPAQGEVVAVGPGKVKEGKSIAMTVKIGDKVLYSKYSPQEVKVDGTEYLIISEEDILAIIEK
ncbi:MAG: co-chaperone GroES [Patescibacteria group bacterium]|nr:co-chaperone GroES [Patescibacteria group bacterium]